MSAIRRLSFCSVLLGFVAIGCPTTGDDDDSTPVTDDDDDDDFDACAATDITANVGGANYMGSNAGLDDGIDPPADCTDGGSADSILVLTAASTGTLILSTDNEGTNFDTVIWAFSDCADPEGTALGCADDVVPQQVLTSTMSIEVTAGQVVYVDVEGWDGEGDYELSAEIAVCGDGTVSSTEACDDGGTDNGDGCDASCRWECTDDAYEDNDDVKGATPIVALPATLDTAVLCPGDVSPIGEGLAVDFYKVETQFGQYLTASVAAGGGLTAACADLNLAVGIYDAELNALAADDATDDACPSASAEPDPGTWYIAVFHQDFRNAPQDYVLTLEAGVSSCGDGEVTGVEQCDDGGNVGGDGCSPACFFEDASCDVAADVTGELDGDSVTGDTSGSTDVHAPACSDPGSPDLVYEFTPAADGRVVLSTDLPGTAYDTVLYVRTDCLDPSTTLACNDDVDLDAGNYNSHLFWSAVQGTTYYIVVDGWNGESGAFELAVTTTDCGDSAVEFGEDCDDGNETAGDGCENDCSFTPVCSYAADTQLGLVAAGASATTTVDLAGGDDDLGDLACSEAGGNDASVGFGVAVSGYATIEIDAGEGDVQYAVFAEDGCETALSCSDFYPNTAGTLYVPVEPGLYRLVLDAFQSGTESEVSVTVSVPAL